MTQQNQQNQPPRKPHNPPATRSMEPDWKKTCIVCGARPIVPASGMCGPCTFGEADTAGGNW